MRGGGVPSGAGGGEGEGDARLMAAAHRGLPRIWRILGRWVIIGGAGSFLCRARLAKALERGVGCRWGRCVGVGFTGKIGGMVSVGVGVGSGMCLAVIAKWNVSRRTTARPAGVRSQRSVLSCLNSRLGHAIEF